MFSQTAEYSMRAMACLALYPDRLVSTPELASQTQVPVNYLAKVLQQLSAAGLIGGRRGVGGGYKLARPATDVKMIDVVRAVGTLKRITACPLGMAAPGGNLCPLHRMTDRVAKAAIEILEGVTLQDLINDGVSNKPLCEPKTPALVTVNGSARPGRRPKPVG